MARAGYKFQSVGVGYQRYLSRRGRLAEDKNRDISVQARLKGERVLGSTLRGYPVFLRFCAEVLLEWGSETAALYGPAEIDQNLGAP